MLKVSRMVASPSTIEGSTCTDPDVQRAAAVAWLYVARRFKRRPEGAATGGRG
jgi:hypothetical protein